MMTFVMISLFLVYTYNLKISLNKKRVNRQNIYIGGEDFEKK